MVNKMLVKIEFDELIIRILEDAYKLYKEILFDGVKPSGKTNQFGDQSLIMDISIEKLIINSCYNAKIPLRIVSEEHGTIDLDLNPKYTLFLDGLDGSNVYKNHPVNGRFGTMVAIYNGLDPYYGDYISAGIIEYSTNYIYICSKGRGSYLIKNNEKKIRITCKNNKNFNKKSKIYIDKAFDINNKIFSKPLLTYNTIYLKASVPYYVDFIQGKCTFVLECTRKNNLEIACAYALIKESGGYMVDLNGNEIGTKKHFAFASNKCMYIPVITTSSIQMYKKLMLLIKV